MLNSDFDFEGQFEDNKNMFHLLKQEEKEELEKKQTLTRYKRNEFIFKEGDKPAGMLYLKEGKVKIFKEGVGGREQIVRMVEQNGFIGYRSLLADELHNGSAVAIEESVVITIPPHLLYNVLLHNYEFSLALLKSLSKELGFSNQRTVSLTQKHIRGRLAESLLLLRDKYGFEHDAMTLRVYLSREDIANLSNMTTSNAIRTLSTFAGEKLIAIDGRKIKILNLRELEKTSKLG
jgi:CRP-like cAMP-binding protein